MCSAQSQLFQCHALHVPAAVALACVAMQCEPFSPSAAGAFASYPRPVCTADDMAIGRRSCSATAGAPSGARHHSETAGFMEVATKQVYGTASGGGSMAERVGRRKFFNDRTGTDNAFRR